ncbi:histidine--tRNA ligase [bacterium AH-315-P15]|nr:histidine--tRNA ligase [bacterium AH-315-P15]
MAKKQKNFRPKARVPKGLRDRRANDVRAEREVLARVQRLYELYGFEPLATPAFEFADALGKFLPDQDRPNEGVFSFQDDDEQWISLRYDLTAPLARFVAEHYDDLPKPFRRYQSGFLWRNEKPGPGRFREFLQIDADTVGTPLMAADAEMMMLLADGIEAAGVARGDYTVRVNNRKVLDGVLEHIGVLRGGDRETEAKRLSVLRAIDKLDRLGPDGVCQLLGKGRKDESGDYTEGAELSPEQIDVIMAFTCAAGGTSAQTLDNLRELVGRSAIGLEGVGELDEIKDLLSAAGYDESRAIIDPSVVRGLGYYTGPVFEVDLDFEITNEKGEVVRFGSVGSGGRYDGLVERFKGVKVPATGCSLGISRLLAALEARGAAREVTIRSPVVVLVLDRERIAGSQAMVQELRKAGVRAEMYLGGSGMRAQIKYADKRGSPIAVIEGEDERAKGEVTLKDLILGSRLSAEIEDNKVWREDQPAQLAVPRDRFVTEVRKMLSRHEQDMGARHG